MLICASLAAANACAASRPGRTLTPSPGAEEALLAAVIGRAAARDSASVPSAQVICVSVGEDSARSDPPGALLRRLRALDPRVRPASRCPSLPAEAPPGASTVARVWLGPPEPGGVNAALARASWVRGPLWGYGYICRLVRRDAGWSVESCELEWIA